MARTRRSWLCGTGLVCFCASLPPEQYCSRSKVSQVVRREAARKTLVPRWALGSHRLAHIGVPALDAGQGREQTFGETWRACTRECVRAGWRFVVCSAQVWRARVTRRRLQTGRPSQTSPCAEVGCARHPPASKATPFCRIREPIARGNGRLARQGAAYLGHQIGQNRGGDVADERWRPIVSLHTPKRPSSTAMGYCTLSLSALYCISVSA